MVAADKTFDYDIAAINDFTVETEIDPKTGNPLVKHVLVKDEPFNPSERFWTSMFARFGFNKSFFKYFDYAEVFNRISDTEANDHVRVCVERGKNSKSRLLAVSNPKKPIVPYDDIMGIVGDSSVKTDYSNGILMSTHVPRSGSNSFNVNGDLFENQFVMHTPIDGYGKPSVYLALLRQICENGMVGFSKAFRSQITLGKGDDNVAFALTRVLDQFGNDEGYAALRNRIESSAQSWASVNECMTLYKMLTKLHQKKDDEEKGIVNSNDFSNSPYLQGLAFDGNNAGLDYTSKHPLFSAFHSMTGDMSRLYGLANLDALSQKRQRTLPAKCTVYDLINFATEVATHHASVNSSRVIHAWAGTLVTGEYDLEGTMNEMKDFADFHINSSLSAGVTGSENATPEFSVN